MGCTLTMENDKSKKLTNLCVKSLGEVVKKTTDLCVKNGYTKKEVYDIWLMVFEIMGNIINTNKKL